MFRYIVILVALFTKSIIPTTVNKNNLHIKNSNVPLCKNCIYYIPFTTHREHIHLSQCSKFGEMNIINGEIEYHYAYECRNNENCCGYNGKYYEERKYPHITNNMIQKENKEKKEKKEKTTPEPNEKNTTNQETIENNIQKDW